MENSNLEIAQALTQLYKSFVRPFPYNDCRKLLRAANEPNFSGLIPDLDVYFADIAGRANSGKRILKWPKEKLLQVQKEIRRSFFEKHPVYLPLRPKITRDDTPVLFEDLEMIDEMRSLLHELLSRLEKET